ncbi:MAG: cytochrome c biogenesis protein CcsA [Armatimonadota bacterium]
MPVEISAGIGIVMQTGNLLLSSAFAVTIAAIAAYITSGLGYKRFRRYSRAAYFLSTILITCISAYFMALILTNHFDVRYIAEYSSRELPIIYKISVFWAGAQGSLLFWALASGIIGLIVMQKSREFEPWTMAFLSVVQALFLYLLLVDSPFKPMLITPADGMGLRELLRNPWMAVHPPVTFIGYAAISVPAAFAVAALIKGDFSRWRKAALPWALLGWVTLGAGIVFGSYWAYEVLGWGGYWGWDPVENSSLVPWIIGTALLHTMIAERYRGSFRRVNVVLALLAFTFVFYATFLTRSNVIKDSVHTFGDTATAGPLVCFILAFLAISIVLMAWRWKKLTGEPSYTSVTSKDFLFFLAAIFIVTAGFLVITGTSAPIIGSIISKKISLKPDFYNKTVSPVALIVLALMALAPVISWSRNREPSKRQRALLIAALVLICAVFIVALITREYLTVTAIGILTVAIAGLATNAYTLVRSCRFGLRGIGGFLSHAGISIMFLGIVLSANGGTPENLTLIKDKPAAALLTESKLSRSKREYRFTYQGYQDFGDRMKLNIRVESGKKPVNAAVMIPTAGSNDTPPKPAIISSFVRDIYIAPQAGPERKEGLVELGKPVELSGYTLTFINFAKSSGNRVGAKLEVESNGQKHTIIPWLVKRSESSPTVDVPGMSSSIGITGISVEEHAVDVVFTPKSGKPQVFRLVKGEEKTAAGGYRFLFKKWFFPSGGMGDMQAGARIDITHSGKTVSVEPVYSPNSGASAVSRPVKVPVTGDIIELLDLDINKGLIELAVTTDSAVVSVSAKPFMSLFWSGAILTLMGGTIALWRRVK